MSPAELLALLNERGVVLKVAAGRLRIDAPKGVLTPGLQAALVAHKAEIIELLTRSGSREISPALSPRPGEQLPVSYAQQGEWYLNQLMPGSSVSNFNVSWIAEGPLHVVALERGLNEIVRRHEALRTTFTLVEGRPVQVIVPTMRLTIPVIDLRHLPEREREKEAQRLAAQDASRAFDLTSGPFVRIILLRLAEQEHLICFTIHHIATDGWSLGIFGQELMLLYGAFSRGESSPLPDLSVQYRDFVAWQQQHLAGERLERLLDYWKRELDGAPRLLELPTDRPRPPVMTFRGAHKSFDLSASLLTSLKEMSRREGVTLFMTLMTAFQTWLHLSSGQEEILVGNNIANRPRIEFEPVQGIFVNTLVLRTKFSGDPSLREVLTQVRRVALAAYEHQDLPFERLVKEVQPRLSPAHAPVVQVGFSMRNMLRTSLELPDLRMRPCEIDTGAALLDLVMFVMKEGPDGLHGMIEYSVELFEPETIERLVEHFKLLLTQMSSDLDRRMSNLAPLLKAQSQQVPQTAAQAAGHITSSSDLEQLSDEEVDALLLQMLAAEAEPTESSRV